MKKLDLDMTQALYDALAERTTRSFEGYEAPRKVSQLKVPGDLAFFLDNLIEFAEKELGASPEDTLAEVVDRGIVSWYGELSADSLSRLGIPAEKVKGALDSVREKDTVVAAAEAPASVKDARRQLDTAKTEYRKTLANLEAVIGRLRKEQKAEREKIVRQSEEIRKLQAKLSDATVEEQPPEDTIHNFFAQAYTPLTSHVVMKKTQKGKGNPRAQGRR